MLFTFIDKYSNILFQLIATMILARLLSPYEFGLIAVVMVFITFFSLLTEMGIGPAIVQRQDLTGDDCGGIFAVTFWIGGVFAALFYCVAPWIAAFYRDEAYISIVHWLSLIVLFSAWSIVPRALLVKRQAFSCLAKCNVAVNLLGNGLAVYLAVNGWSYYAILFRSLSSSFLLFLLMVWLCGLHPAARIRWAALRKIAGFSAFQFAFNFINYFSRNLDKLLVGRYLGADALGLYDKAYMLMLLPVNNLTHVLTPVLQTLLARHQQELDLVYGTYMKLVRILALLGVPISVLCYFGAREIIELLFGAQWLGIVAVFQILALSIWLQVVLSSSGSIFQVVNRTDLLFLSGVLSLGAMASAIAAGIGRGRLEDMAAYLTAAFMLNFVQGYYLLLVRAMGRSMAEFLRVLVKPLLIGGMMSAAMACFGTALELESAALGLSAKAAVLLTAYVAGLRLTGEWDFFRGIFGRAKRMPER